VGTLFALKLAEAKRIKPDHKRDFVAKQLQWPVHRKWMKELYEARSSRAHRGPRSGFSRNWEDQQHMVIAAFAYPLAVKLRLSAAGLYKFDDPDGSHTHGSVLACSHCAGVANGPTSMRSGGCPTCAPSVNSSTTRKYFVISCFALVGARGPDALGQKPRSRADLYWSPTDRRSGHW
jgi:hypothetical protein